MKQIINLLPFNNFYHYRQVQKESDELLYTVRSLVMVRNQLPAQVVNLSRWNDVHVENCPKIAIFSQF